MPGIFGFTRQNESNNEAKECLYSMQKLLTHGDFYLKDELFLNEHIAASRTHIGVLSQALQPYVYQDLLVWLDGEFYDEDGLLQLAASISQEDLAGLRALDGIFSAVAYHRTKKKLYLVNDRYGLKHLYTTQRGESFSFASEIKAFLSLPGARPKLHKEAIADFFRTGYFLGDNTWFEGISLLPPASFLCWDLRTKALSEKQYFQLEDLRPFTEKVDPRELTEELGCLFTRSVQRRAKDEEKIGITLSGGLDSRAILAAISPRDNLHTVTFGEPSSEDVRYAKMAADLKGVTHQSQEITAENWLPVRLDAVWWTDGQLDIRHMHIASLIELISGNFDISLDGFLGDATVGGSYFGDKRFSFFDKIRNRGRRLIMLGPKLLSTMIEVRLPFFDWDFFSFAQRIPEALRKDSLIYNEMLLKSFPEFFERIPWQKTGVPISFPRFIQQGLYMLRKLKDSIRWRASHRGFTLLAGKYREQLAFINQPKNQDIFDNLLKNPAALYPEILPREEVLVALEQHRQGKNRFDILCRALTAELWLRQAFLQEQRPNLLTKQTPE
jgi:asparagine synthase (glutamine-hydrolysing)